MGPDVPVGAPAPGPSQGEGPSASPTRPHDGQVASLAKWWQHFDDPLLSQLMDEAQASSPTVAQALARVREARAQAQGAGANLGPTIGAGADVTRASNASSSFRPVTQGNAALQAQWEIDLFGGVRHQHEAALSRAEQARLGWHEARVTLAAEVAQTYLQIRACEGMVQVLEAASASQRKSAELTREKVRVGFEAPANGALADATVADAANRLAAQRADCDALVLALTQLTSRPTEALRASLVPRRAVLPQPGLAFDVDRLPAQVLVHRPDVANAEAALVAAEAEVSVARAARWPRLVLSGSIGHGLVRLGGEQTQGPSWGFFPSLSLPLLDAGRLAAQVDGARARRDGAHAALDARIRLAIREVEESMVRLAAARQREADATKAAQGFGAYFQSVEQRWRLGAGSVIELEEARRLALNAQAALIGLQRERIGAWIALYRSTGGGWRAEEGTAVSRAAP